MGCGREDTNEEPIVLVEEGARAGEHVDWSFKNKVSQIYKRKL